MKRELVLQGQQQGGLLPIRPKGKQKEVLTEPRESTVDLREGHLMDAMSSVEMSAAQGDWVGSTMEEIKSLTYSSSPLSPDSTSLWLKHFRQKPKDGAPVDAICNVQPPWAQSRVSRKG